MKKLFFFRSNSGNGNQGSPPSTDKRIDCEKTPEKSRINKHDSEDNAPCLRRSLSFSSGFSYETGKKIKNYADQNGSPCSSSHHSHKQSMQLSSRSRALTPERLTRINHSDAAVVNNSQRTEKFNCIVSGAHSDLSENSSHCSSNVSNKVLDRYIDGEQHNETNELNVNFSLSDRLDKRSGVGKRLPPGFAQDSRKQKPKCQSFRETKLSQFHPSSRVSGDNRLLHKSPRKLAKKVVERLSHSQLLSEMRSKEAYLDKPITIEDIYSRNLKRCSTAHTDEISQKNCVTDWNSETGHHEEKSEFLDRQSCCGDKIEVRGNVDALTETDLELFNQFKEAEDRAALLSEELEQGNFLEVRGLSLPILIQIIRGLTEEKAKMALEVSSVLQDRIAEKALFREELKRARSDIDLHTRRLEKEKNELQSTLEKELDRRSDEWSLKLEKYQAEEHRLRERVRELAEQNVGLQREVSSLSEREVGTKTKITNSEKQLEELAIQVREAKEENHFLQKNLSELRDKARVLEEDRDYTRRNYKEKVTECKDMHQAISRLQRTCSDQEKTIDGLRGFCEELGKKISSENYNFGLAKVQMEQMRLTGVEHALRKEVESSRVEIDSLRCENINLLNRLKNNGDEGKYSTFKLDQELQNRISCLQEQVLPWLTESNQLCRKLLENIKSKASQILEKGSHSDTAFTGQIFECEVKLQGLERAAENLICSMRTLSSVLHEKSTILHDMVHPVATDSHEPPRRKDAQAEEIIISELKAETLLTSLLREKLYSKELTIEQLQAELGAAIRVNDILKCEVQNAMDNFSCANHKNKDLELQMMKKDEIIDQLKGDLQDNKKELAIVRGILPKVSEERDLMWEKVKQCSEQNMLLNSEVNAMRKKIEALDEDILLKEGQITILKDSIGKPFDLLASPDSSDNLCWKDSR
ncbi:myosin-3 [Dorcoceras hygrometricum]|uniref:Myosin-3 n=1 Tax=Dorcoceras hygrometricum TaxID=472368 RepID=A0A2Z7AT41_9LAMI|nr:myosin-3 [Dorcoceras hygrometricum]